MSLIGDAAPNELVEEFLSMMIFGSSSGLHLHVSMLDWTCTKHL